MPISTKHTPGPWEAFGKMVRASGRTICNAQRPPTMDEPQDVTVAIGEANAQFIAASPDMFSALLAARDYFQRLGDPEDAPTYSKILAAIKKAEGQ